MNKKAFTLIELLVVVLIIGILAAVALPQYQKAVVKTRYATLKSLTRSIADAAEVYYLANGHYPASFADLDIQLPTPTSTNEDNESRTYDEYTFDWGMCRLMPGNYAFTKCRNNAISMDYQIYFEHSLNGRQALCVFIGEDLTAPQTKVCQQETGNTPVKNTGYISANY